MIPDDLKRTIKLPIRIVDGVPQPFYGPSWPRLKDGTIGELTLPAFGFLNPEDESVLSAPLGTDMLPEGTRLLAAVSSLARAEGVLTIGNEQLVE